MIFHPGAKRCGDSGAEAVAAIEEDGEGKGAAGGAEASDKMRIAVHSAMRLRPMPECRRLRAHGHE